MTAAATPQATAPPQNRLSIPQMLCVMRVEFHRARSQRYPITCLMVAVDGIDAVLERHGYEAQQQAMRATYDCLRDLAREHAFIGMALMSGDRIMAVFPNASPPRLGELSERLLRAAREVALDAGGQSVPLTLSLGASHNLHADTREFEGFVEMAGRSLAIAREAGGDRYVMWREAEIELVELRSELEHRTRTFQEQHAALVEEASDAGGLQQAAVIDEIRRVFASTPRTDEIARLEREIVALAARELHEERQKAVAAQVAEHKRQIEVLERRLTKLVSVLGLTEKELQRVLAMKSIDPGVASIYRTVQGLSLDDAAAEQKQAMMAEIFDANLALQKGENKSRKS